MDIFSEKRAVIKYVQKKDYPWWYDDGRGGCSFICHGGRDGFRCHFMVGRVLKTRRLGGPENTSKNIRDFRHMIINRPDSKCLILILTISYSDLWLWVRQHSKQLKHKDSPCTKKAKTVPSAGKVTASVLWDADGIIKVVYRRKGIQLLELTIHYFLDCFEKTLSPNAVEILLHTNVQVIYHCYGCT